MATIRTSLISEMDRLISDRELSDPEGGSSPKRRCACCFVAAAVLAALGVAISCVDTSGPTDFLHRIENGSVTEYNVSVVRSFSVPGEWNKTCDTSSPNFTFDNDAKGVDREMFSISAVIVMIVDALQAGLAMLSTPAEPIPAIDEWLVDPQFQDDMSMRFCPGNHFIRLGNLVPDTKVWKGADCQWSSLVKQDPSRRFRMMGEFAELMATTIPKEGRRKGAELKFHRAVQALFDQPKQIKINVPPLGKFKFNLPWNVRTGKYLFFGQLLFMICSMARMSWFSRPDFVSIVFWGGDYEKWMHLAFRREMLLPIVFRIYYVFLNYTNVQVFFRGSTQGIAMISKCVFWVLTVISALPLLFVFAPALTVTFGLACLMCVIVSYVRDDISSDGRENANTWWRWPPHKHRPQFLPFLTSMCLSSVIVGQLFYSLSEDTYLCTHARIRLWSIRDPFRFDASFMGFAFGWGTASVVVLLCLYIVAWAEKGLRSIGCGKRNCCTWLAAVEHYMSDPIIAYENWMAFPMYNLTAMRFDTVEYARHCKHFLLLPKPASVEPCSYCKLITQLVDDHNQNALEGERLLCKMFDIPYQLPELERAASEARQASDFDPSDIKHLESCINKLKHCTAVCKSVCDDSEAMQHRSSLPRRLTNAVGKGDVSHAHLDRILSGYRELRKCLDVRNECLSSEISYGYEALPDASEQLRRAHAELKKMLQEVCPHFAPDDPRDTEGFKIWKEATEVLEGIKGVDFSAAVQVAVLCDAAAKGDMETLRRFAASTGQTETVKFVVPATTQFVNASHYDRRTPLHLAASTGQLEVVKFLIDECCATPDPRDRWQRTPLDDARRFKHDDVVAYLDQFNYWVKGAEPDSD